MLGFQLREFIEAHKDYLKVVQPRVKVYCEQQEQVWTGDATRISSHHVHFTTDAGKKLRVSVKASNRGNTLFTSQTMSLAENAWVALSATGDFDDHKEIVTADD